MKLLRVLKRINFNKFDICDALIFGNNEQSRVYCEFMYVYKQHLKYVVYFIAFNKLFEFKINNAHVVQIYSDAHLLTFSNFKKTC